MRVKGHFRTDPRSGHQVWVESHNRTGDQGTSSEVSDQTRDALIKISDPALGTDDGENDVVCEFCHEHIPESEFLAHDYDCGTETDGPEVPDDPADGLRRELVTIETELETVTAAIRSTEGPRRALIDQNAQLAETARRAVTDLYTRHGVPPRMATFLTGDTIEKHTTRSGFAPSPGQPDHRTVLVHPIQTLKTKRGELGSVTKAANNDLPTDPALTGVNESLGRNLNTLRNLPPTDNALIDRRFELRRRHDTLRRELAALEHAQARAAQEQAAARHDSILLDHFQNQHHLEPDGAIGTLNEQAERMRRNPDGTTNVYVWVPNPGANSNSPEGTWAQAQGITALNTQGSQTNALILADGQLVYDTEHLARTSRGGHAQTSRGNVHRVVTIEPARDATPLTDETHATTFRATIDSTD